MFKMTNVTNGKPRSWNTDIILKMTSITLKCMSSITEVDADQRQKWLQSKENTNRLEFCLGVHECTSPPVRERKVRRPKAPLSPLQKKNGDVGTPKVAVWRQRPCSLHPRRAGKAERPVKRPPRRCGFRPFRTFPKLSATVKLYSNTKVTRAQLREQRQFSLQKPQKHRLRRNPWQNP